MTRIPPLPLWLGHAGDGECFEELFRADIRAVIYLAIEEMPARLPRDLISCRFPLVDGPGNAEELLALAIRTLADHLQWQVPTLATCGAGLSRSPAIAAAALAVAHRRCPEDCLQLIAGHHAVDVSPGLWNDVRQLAGKLL